MDRAALVCKHCNQAFSRRDQFELHQKTHFENNLLENPPLMVQAPPPPQQMVFYNQPPEQSILRQQPPLTTPMNFYTENMSSNPMQLLQPKTEYPIMNQLLSGLNSSMLQPSKSFVCGICGNTFFKKKELDRHVITIHTNVNQFQCGSCPKVFNRKDKLVRHEKTHNVASVFNCSLCPAVFVRKQMLDFHSKIHNGDQQGHSQLESFLASLQQHPVVENNGMSHNNSMMDVDASQQLMTAMVQSSVPESPAKHYPMNLSMSKSPPNEPMNLSSDRVESTKLSSDRVEPTNLSSDRVEPTNLSNDRVEPTPIVTITKVEKSPTRIIIDSDDDNEVLRIVEEAPVIKKSPSLLNLFKNLPEPVEQLQMQMPIEPMVTTENGAIEMKPQFDEPMKNIEEISFAMTSRIANLDKLEPLRDLPMEILNND
jgi:Zinc finger, C2H2 type